MQLVLDIWREFGRHQALEESMPAVATLLSQNFPLSLTLVRRFAFESFRLETAWAGTHDSSHVPPRVRTELTPKEQDELVEWCARATVTLGDTANPSLPLRLAVPSGLRGGAMIGPLCAETGPLGLLVLVSPPARVFSNEHAELLRSLLEPFAAALSNDGRLHRLESQRQAMEADKDALLSRLERQDIAVSVVGSETGLRGVMEQVEQVAPTNAPVLILGETGTGKEVISRHIHSRSRRADGPLFRVNCGAIPPELVDSELFGHERGSFTGAVSARKGWFERADGGTLFLDEVAELPLSAQVRLLRVLQDGLIERVGGQRAVTVDVRIVAATNANLAELVREGRFREDLWYRISVFPITLPPLRARLADLPALATHFAWGAGKRLGGAPLVTSLDDIRLLVSYHWPGNVRELAAVIERAAILGNGKRLEIAAALGAGTQPPAERLKAGIGAARVFASGDVRFQTLDEAMCQHIESALVRARGRVEGNKGAAALLAINPHTLRARMRRLGIDWGRFREE